MRVRRPEESYSYVVTLPSGSVICKTRQVPNRVHSPAAKRHKKHKDWRSGVPGSRGPAADRARDTLYERTIRPAVQCLPCAPCAFSWPHSPCITSHEISETHHEEHEEHEDGSIMRSHPPCPSSSSWFHSSQGCLRMDAGGPNTSRGVPPGSAEGHLGICFPCVMPGRRHAADPDFCCRSKSRKVKNAESRAKTP